MSGEIDSRERFVIKAGYRENFAARASGAWETEQFWNAERIRNASLYQYWVYRWATRFAEIRGVSLLLQSLATSATAQAPCVTRVRVAYYVAARGRKRSSNG